MDICVNSSSERVFLRMDNYTGLGWKLGPTVYQSKQHFLKSDVHVVFNEATLLSIMREETQYANNMSSLLILFLPVSKYNI